MLNTIKTKKCNKCQVEKSVEEFYKDKTRKDGLCSNCKNCTKAYKEANREVIALRKKAYNQLNRKAIAEQKKAYNQANSEAIALRRKAYNQANKEQIKAYSQSNSEKIALRRKAYRQANYVALAVKMKAYNQLNRKAIAEQKKAYYQTPMGKAVRKNIGHRRRSIKKQGDVTTQQLLELEQNAKVCYWCGISLKNKKVHIDHYVPLSKGGEHTLSNLVVSCSKCNLTKNAKDPIIFAQSIGKLF